MTPVFCWKQFLQGHLLLTFLSFYSPALLQRLFFLKHLQMKHCTQHLEEIIGQRRSYVHQFQNYHREIRGYEERTLCQLAPKLVWLFQQLYQKQKKNFYKEQIAWTCVNEQRSSVLSTVPSWPVPNKVSTVALKGLKVLTFWSLLSVKTMLPS